MAPAGRPALSRRDVLRCGPLSARSRRSGMGGGGIGRWVRCTFADLCREQSGSRANISRLSTRAAYRSYLDRHFLPFFGSRPMARILPSLVQEWVTKATAEGLSPRSVRKYHTVLHSIFERAVRDQMILINPCEHTELPKIIVRRTRTLTPDEFGRLIAAIPERIGCWSQRRSRRACAGAS